ncbi:MAG: formylglycine-generating enzyme family protein [Gammaproteobacteria bacterium]
MGQVLKLRCPLIRTLACTLVTFVLTSGVGAWAGDLSGDWYFDVVSPNGPGHRDVLFRQEDSRVIGFIESDSASGRFVGSISGANLQFTAVLEFGGQPMAAVYRATVDGDRMTGTIDFGSYGQATFKGYRGRRLQTSVPLTIEGSARHADLAVASSGDNFGVMQADVLVPEMADIPAGIFRMGNNSPAVKPEYGADFAHVHEVRLSQFRISRFPITNAQFLAFSVATKREAVLPPRGWDSYAARYPTHPVVNVNFDDAKAYTGWLSGVTGRKVDLPTEAQWEYAARAGVDGRNFVFGDQWQVRGANTATWHIGKLVDRDGWKAWWDTDGKRLSRSQVMTTRVGSFAPNAWGLYDMTGNVWEWTRDWYQANYYDVSPRDNPLGPRSGTEKVLRGCSWYNQPDVCFLATRDRYTPEQRLYYNGFRIVEDGVAVTEGRAGSTD